MKLIGHFCLPFLICQLYPYLQLAGTNDARGTSAVRPTKKLSGSARVCADKEVSSVTLFNQKGPVLGSDFVHFLPAKINEILVGSNGLVLSFSLLLAVFNPSSRVGLQYPYNRRRYKDIMDIE